MDWKATDINQRLSGLLDSDKPFALVRFPGENCYVLNPELTLLPFNSRYSERFAVNDNGESIDHFYDSTEKETYISRVAVLIDELKENNRKVVISRVIDGHISFTANSELATSILRLFDSNPKAFAAVIRSRRAGLWIVLTPELLIEQCGDRLSTMALAGTRPKGTPCDWDNKNMREQQFVTDFIVNSLKECGLTPAVDSTFTREAGNVEHICSPITALSSPEIPFGKIIDAINPTPAVCGLPREYALERIKSIEGHDRLLYGGAIAVRHTDDCHDVFVTLRCAHLNLDGRFNIFVGGGITADSIPADEWHETELKARPILNALTSLNA